MGNCNSTPCPHIVPNDLSIATSLLDSNNATTFTVIPFSPRYLNIAPSHARLHTLDSLTLVDLLQLAFDGDKSVELLHSIHRKLAASWILDGKWNTCDCVERDENEQNKRWKLIMGYDLKWEVRRVGDRLGGVRRLGRDRYRGPL